MQLIRAVKTQHHHIRDGRSEDFYIAGDPVEWTLTVNCAILDYEYQIKTEVIQSLTGDVAYGEKTEWWVQPIHLHHHVQHAY